MPRRIAVVTTIYRYLSHAQHMADRFLIGYPYAGQWHRPDMKVVTLYVDPKPEGDQSAERAKEFGFTVYPTIAETLRQQPRVATTEYLDALGAASRRLEQTLGDESGSPFANALQQALPAVEELAEQVIARHITPLA